MDRNAKLRGDLSSQMSRWEKLDCAELSLENPGNTYKVWANGYMSKRLRETIRPCVFEILMITGQRNAERIRPTKNIHTSQHSARPTNKRSICGQIPLSAEASQRTKIGWNKNTPPSTCAPRTLPSYGRQFSLERLLRVEQL